ncbi:hypothetical protein Y032_0530g2999 [Ancylostoma ceylanicum]|uniref:Uncharacterized protein n=1 Tax=Ancylostoma ceylanicum TaxID=53326 RepID=A0A016WS52_9BILA|nr:hypothetical protein Y032_0530g2999 [Ancylostoma ceylanicum]
MKIYPVVLWNNTFTTIIYSKTIVMSFEFGQAAAHSTVMPLDLRSSSSLSRDLPPPERPPSIVMGGTHTFENIFGFLAKSLQKSRAIIKLYTTCKCNKSYAYLVHQLRYYFLDRQQESPASNRSNMIPHKVGSTTEEVNVTLSFVNKPVDENGDGVRESVDALDEDDDVFLADNEIEELEQFVVAESTQTNLSVANEDKNQQTMPQDFDIFIDTRCQTSPVLLKDMLFWEALDEDDSQATVPEVQWIVRPTTCSSEAQAVVPTEHTMVQYSFEEGDKTEDVAEEQTSYSDSETQTSELAVHAVEVQTNAMYRTTESVEAQTDTFYAEHRAASVQCEEYLPEHKSSEVQSDVSMFTVDFEDSINLEAKHHVRFNVESSTSMEENQYKTLGTQSDEVETDSVEVQCTPTVSTSQTQHTCSVMTDESVQTEMSMKNKKNQECDASVETKDAFAQKIPDCKEESVQAVKSSTDSIVDAEHNGTNTVMQTGPALWSDFDRTPFSEFYWDVSQQTSPVVMNDSECQFTLDVTSQEVQTTRLNGEDVSDKCCGTKTDMEDNAAQATVKLHDVASGQPDSESWIKVYIAELDEERLSRMVDIGIQTGVLARVQHLYTPEELEESASGSSQSSVRLSIPEESPENTTQKRQLKRRASAMPHISISESSVVDRFRTGHEPLSPLKKTSHKPRRTSADVSTRVGDAG